MDDMGATSRRERAVSIVSLVLTLGAVSGYLALDGTPLGDRLRAAAGVDDRVRPAVTVDARGAHAFLGTQPGSDDPVGFSPCRPVRYAVNPTGAPTGWQQHVDTAVAELEARTGLELESVGTTGDRDFGARLGAGPEPEPVLIGWADEDEVGDLADDVAGVGGPTTVEVGGRLAYVSGSVVLDVATTDRLAASPGGAELQVALLLHELGHLVGLDHVDDRDELMHVGGLARTSYGPGDREGLAALGAAPCW